MPSGGHLAEEDFVAVKTRPPTPNDPQGAGFWLQTHGAPGGLPLEETGFINSQPSMAEFMTALPHIPGGEGLPHGPPLSPQQTPPGYQMDHQPHGLGSPGVNVPEYPWMKEKKTTRKSSQQGNNIFFYFWVVFLCVLETILVYIFIGGTK